MWATLVFAIIAALTFVISSKLPKDVGTESGELVAVYYLNSYTMELETEEKFLKTSSDEEEIKFILNQVFSAPSNVNLISAAPKSITIDDLNVEMEGKDLLKINFSSKYKNVSNREDIVFRGALVYSLSELDFLNSFIFYVDGVEMTTESKMAIGTLSKSNVELNPAIFPKKFIATTLQLYFTNPETMEMGREERVIAVNPDRGLETYIVEQLLLGPKEPELGYVSTIPSNTKIRSVITENHICYVDLSQEFVTGQVNDVAVQEQAIYSIVNSLTEIEKITKVQFFIESKKVVGFPNGLELSQTFERNKNLIEE